MAQLSDNHFIELKDWSERKHNLISKYIASATKILGRIDHVYYIDGFAGRGSYGERDDDKVPGSPVRAAKLAQELKNQGKSYNLSCINIEIDRNNFVELDEATEPYKDVVTNLKGSFSDSINDVLRIIGRKPAICFLDPFGINGIDLTTIRKLIRRGGITDFWIRFEAGQVRRRDGYYLSNAPGADKNFNILRRVYGINDDDRLHNLLDGNSPDERKRNAVLLYMQVLSQEFENVRGSGYSAAYRIRSLKGEDKYHLVFSTANEKGLNLASDIVYGIEESYQKQIEWYRETQSSGQMSLFAQLDPTEKEIFEKKVKEIQEKVLQEWSGKSVTRRTIHSNLLMHNWFGLIKGKHLTNALTNLSNEKKVSYSSNISDDNTLFKFE